MDPRLAHARRTMEETMTRGRGGIVGQIAPRDRPVSILAVRAEATIGERIARARRARRMTQEGLAGEIGCDRSAIARWEAGSRMPRLSHLLTLCRVLGCAPGSLLPDGGIREEDADARHQGTTPPPSLSGWSRPGATVNRVRSERHREEVS